MSSQHSMPLNTWNEIKELPGNKKCVDCGSANPQWASVSYGTLFCLQCSGKHRSLGVHLSFVRSITMDSWTNKQIKMMKFGNGNETFLNTLIEHSEFNSINDTYNIPMSVKYNSKIAAWYRDMLRAKVDNNIFNQSCPNENFNNNNHMNGNNINNNNNIEGNSDLDNYIKHQIEEKEAAKQRLREKFGNGGMKMDAIGSDPNYVPGGSSNNDNNKLKNDVLETGQKAVLALGSVFGKLGEGLTQVTSTTTQFVSESVQKIKEEDMGSKISDKWGNVQTKLKDPELMNNIKNTTSTGINTIASTAVSGWNFLWSATQKGTGDLLGNNNNSNNNDMNNNNNNTLVDHNDIHINNDVLNHYNNETNISNNQNNNTDDLLDFYEADDGNHDFNTFDQNNNNNNNNTANPVKGATLNSNINDNNIVRNSPNMNKTAKHHSPDDFFSEFGIK